MPGRRSPPRPQPFSKHKNSSKGKKEEIRISRANRDGSGPTISCGNGAATHPAASNFTVNKTVRPPVQYKQPHTTARIWPPSLPLPSPCLCAQDMHVRVSPIFRIVRSKVEKMGGNFAWPIRHTKKPEDPTITSILETEWVSGKLAEGHSASARQQPINHCGYRALQRMGSLKMGRGFTDRRSTGMSPSGGASTGT